MSGTVEGGKKAAKTNRELFGEDWYREIGRIGGKLGKTGGFGYDGRTLMEKIKGKPKYGTLLARKAGSKGGKISRRTK